VLHLNHEQCERLLRNTRHGRLAFMTDGRVEIFPVNYAFDGKNLYFRTAPGAKLLAAKTEAMVAFATDGILPDQAWSAVGRDNIHTVTEEDVHYVRGLGLATWISTYKDFFVTLSIEELAGRHFIFAPQPERHDTEFSYDPEQPPPTPPEDPDPTPPSR